MVYKSSKTDYKIVNSETEEEAALKEGYGDFEIMILGKKPEVVKTEEVKKVAKPKSRKKLSGNSK